MADLEERQYKRVLVRDFLRLSEDDRTLLVEKLADDLDGMIERIRSLRSTEESRRSVRVSASSPPKEFSSKAYNFAEVDFVDDPEIELIGSAGHTRAIMAQFDFIDRLYLQGAKGRIEFGVRRAQLKMASESNLTRSEHLRNGYPYLRYVTLHEDPNCLVLAIDPPPGKATLGNLPLPPGPGPGENRLAEVGTVSGGSQVDLTAELSVSLSVEGITLSDGQPFPGGNSIKRAIEAIAAVAAMKHKGAKDGKMIRRVRIKDKAR